MNSKFIRAVCFLPLLALVGCASSYDCYPCGRVGCSYCPPNPLPYSNYQPCNCTDSIGQAYLANLPAAGESAVAPIEPPNLDYYRNYPDDTTTPGAGEAGSRR